MTKDTNIKVGKHAHRVSSNRTLAKFFWKLGVARVTWPHNFHDLERSRTQGRDLKHLILSVWTTEESAVTGQIPCSMERILAEQHKYECTTDQQLAYATA